MPFLFVAHLAPCFEHFCVFFGDDFSVYNAPPSAEVLSGIPKHTKAVIYCSEQTSVLDKLPLAQDSAVASEVSVNALTLC